jgi:DNA-binding HxlR family transcriptional regulator
MQERSFDDDTFEEEEQELLQAATEQPHADLIADIVGHPDGQPSSEELAYHNPSLSESMIRNRLDTLKEKGIVTEHDLKKESEHEDLPTKCYGLTDTARQLFDQANLYPQEPWQREYASVEKTERIQTLEQLPRS